MATDIKAKKESISERDRALLAIQDRVLWLSINMIHHANQIRPDPGGFKVGGHQASSSSVVTLLTSLYFDFMRAGDRVSIKPHASPVFHAIQYLLGNLDVKYLETLRALHGLQAYPSSTKDPDPVDFSTGSVGLGAVAPNFAALVEEYTRTHLSSRNSGGHRYVSLVGDAELDEGSIWEAIAEPAFAGLSNIIWMVDLNRQSLDRVIPGIRVQVWREMFGANGWKVIDAKYGKRLHAAYAEPNGELLRQAIDDMPYHVYQRLLRISPEALREWLPRTSPHPDDLARLVGRWDDRELQDLIGNLGGHDFPTLREALAEADEHDGPSVVFGYTHKGWMLPLIGDPQNHSVLLTGVQMEELRTRLGISDEEPWPDLDPDSRESKLRDEVRSRLYPGSSPQDAAPADFPIPTGFGRDYRGKTSTQQTFGLFLTEIGRNIPDVAQRVVTVSPDVASSTNLGGWINKVGVWARADIDPMPEEDTVRALNWQESPQGQHLELGISENNLFMLLGQLGLSYESQGEMLFPIGTLYDPFVRRGLDALFYGVYSGARFIFAGTPSGISLGPEGGAHQSLITPSIGTELPDVAFYEPCFGQEVEWIMLAALDRVRRRERSTYVRLTTKRVDQGLFRLPDDPAGGERLRKQVLYGAYRLVDRSAHPDYEPGSNVVHVIACGAMVPEAVEAGDRLEEEGILANVVNVTGPGPLYRHFQGTVRATMKGEGSSGGFFEDVIPAAERAAPLVTLADAHPHSLAWLGGALGTSVFPLGVSGFGQSGSPSELYGEYEIDASSVVAACFGALGL